MKAAISLSLALLALVPAQAQVFGPRAANGALWGGVAGAIIGHHSGSLGHNGWRGAAYGAGAGLLFGGMADRQYYWRTASQVPLPSYYYPRTYVYRSSPGYYYDEPYYADEVTYGRSNYAANGLLLGALAGAIIGNNSGSLGHNAWRGAAYGAGAGLLIGAVAEHHARRREEAVAAPIMLAPAPAPAASAAVPAPAPAPAAPASPMASANTLFGRN